MSNYFLGYCALISSPEQLSLCRKARSLSDLLTCIKTLWQCHHLSDDELLGEIHRLNQTPVTIDDAALAGCWLPYRYHARSQKVFWLLPSGHATEPFQDEYISRCRQQVLLNQIIQPCSYLDAMNGFSSGCDAVQPAGFIFHLSRCGSTLVSGCLSELDSTCIFSEPPLLTELILDESLSLDEQQGYLRACINLQAAAFNQRPRVIIKWNAWDIIHWHKIREIYPQVPCVFLTRNPIEILASHRRLVGRHMSGDPTLGHLHPVFSSDESIVSFLDRQRNVLCVLLESMLHIAHLESVLVVDYSHLDMGSMKHIGNFFGCMTDNADLVRLQTRMKFHSKTPGQSFIADSKQKRMLFSSMEQAMIREGLEPLYGALLGRVPYGASIQGNG